MFDEGCTTSHRLKCSPLPPNNVGRIGQHIREREGREERNRRKREICLILHLNGIGSDKIHLNDPKNC